jgi:catalase (peroxidase I)
MMRDILKPVHKKFHDVSIADLWTVASCQAIELSGGPHIPFNYGRSDAKDDSSCPPNGRMPHPFLGADELREVFSRMGLNDQDIVALSGAHALGSCHPTRSGFDGTWTTDPLKFDNEYYVNLLKYTWLPKTNENGSTQYYDEETGKLMMLPTDILLIEDEKFLKYVKLYADNEYQFFSDFAKSYSELIAKGCPEKCQPLYKKDITSPVLTPEQEFIYFAMQGSTDRMKLLHKANPSLNVNSKELGTGRTAAHKVR